MTNPTGTTTPATLHFATALSRKTDTEAATHDLADTIRMQIGTAPLIWPSSSFPPTMRRKFP
jgi:hypothetical protein